MRKKAILMALILALVSAVTLANVAFAAQSNKPANSSSGKANTGKGKAKATDSAEQVDNIEDNTKCTILHKGKEITVSINALPAHVLNHSDTLISAEDEEELEEIGQPEDIEQSEDIEQADECQALYNDLNDLTTEAASEADIPEGTVSKEIPQQSTGETPNAQQANEPKETTQVLGTSTQTVRTCDGESTKLSEEEKLTLDLHNKSRKENGLKQLCVDPTLQKAARAHSKDMLKEDYFDHNSRDGKSSGERLKGLGYNWRATGENLARGSGSFSKPKSRFEAWMKSDGHKKNILDKNFEQVGVGVAKGKLKKGGQEETVYTVDFGSKTEKK